MKKSKAVLLIVVIAGVSFGSTLLAMRLAKQWDQAPFLSTWKTPEGRLLPASTVSGAPDFVETAKRIVPSVVSVATQIEGETYFGERVRRDASAGSGVVVSADGYVVTNNHVVRYDTWRGKRLVDRVTVTFSDGTSSEAKIIGTDPRADLAVLKVERQGLVPIDMGDSTKLDVGEWVIAVGNPLGYENSLSVGVVSNIRRPLPSDAGALFIDGIQTDAAINSGNSGGALCDSSGQLVGINTAIASIGGGNIGIGFAIPVNRMRQVVDDIVKFGYAKYGSLGAGFVRRPGVLAMPEAKDELKQLAGTNADPPGEGAVINQVDNGSAAAEAGLKPWDVVVEIDGNKVNDVPDFNSVISPKRPGENVSIKVWQAGQVKTVKVTLREARQEN